MNKVISRNQSYTHQEFDFESFSTKQKYTSNILNFNKS